ncbi:MAG: 2OG-Fe(II) oxygenase [Cyanobacteria bacterium P01_C01_bin.89]
MWKSFNAYPLTEENLYGLIKNTIPLIRVPKFGTDQEAEELAERFLQFAARSNSVKTVTRMGISQYEQGTVGGKDNYFRRVEGAWSNLITVCKTTFNPTVKVMGLLREYFADVDILTEEGYGRYFAGVAKLRTGETPVHSDFPLLGATDWAIAKMEAQLSWNFYLRIPAQGGELRIWDKLWQVEDDRLLEKGTYYHDEKIISDIPSITIKPVLGELILFNSRNYHTVLPAQNRIAMGSWISLMPDESLRLWS